MFKIIVKYIYLIMASIAGILLATRAPAQPVSNQWNTINYAIPISSRFPSANYRIENISIIAKVLQKYSCPAPPCTDFSLCKPCDPPRIDVSVIAGDLAAKSNVTIVTADTSTQTVDMKVGGIYSMRVTKAMPVPSDSWHLNDYSLYKKPATMDAQLKSIKDCNEYVTITGLVTEITKHIFPCPPCAPTTMCKPCPPNDASMEIVVIDGGLPSQSHLSLNQSGNFDIIKGNTYTMHLQRAICSPYTTEYYLNAYNIYAHRGTVQYGCNSHAGLNG